MKGLESFDLSIEILRFLTHKELFNYIAKLSTSSRGVVFNGELWSNIVIKDETVYLLFIYDKSDKENLTDKELDELLKNIPD